jgi:hypothetical protein
MQIHKQVFGTYKHVQQNKLQKHVQQNKLQTASCPNKLIHRGGSKGSSVSDVVGDGNYRTQHLPSESVSLLKAVASLRTSWGRFALPFSFSTKVFVTKRPPITTTPATNLSKI